MKPAIDLEIGARLASLRRRLALVEWLRALAAWLLGALLLLAVAVPLLQALTPSLTPGVVAGVLAVATGASLAAGRAGAPTMTEAALVADRRLGLAERLTTWLELDPDHPARARIEADVAAHIERVGPRLVSPRTPRAVPFLPIAAVAVLAGFLLVSPRRDDGAALAAALVERSARALRDQTALARRLEDLARLLREDAPPGAAMRALSEARAAVENRRRELELASGLADLAAAIRAGAAGDAGRARRLAEAAADLETLVAGPDAAAMRRIAGLLRRPESLGAALGEIGALRERLGGGDRNRLSAAGRALQRAHAALASSSPASRQGVARGPGPLSGPASSGPAGGGRVEGDSTGGSSSGAGRKGGATRYVSEPSAALPDLTGSLAAYRRAISRLVIDPQDAPLVAAYLRLLERESDG